MAFEAGSMARLDRHFRKGRSCRLGPLVAIRASWSKKRRSLSLSSVERLRGHRLQMRGMRKIRSEIGRHLRLGKPEQRRMSLRDRSCVVAYAAKQNRLGQRFEREVMTGSAAHMAGEVFHIGLCRSDLMALRAFERLVLVLVVSEARVVAGLCSLSLLRATIASLRSSLEIADRYQESNRGERYSLDD